MPRTAEGVVIGGGVNGRSIAYQLVLLERRHIGGGPTGRSSDVIRQHYTIETLARMAFDSLRVLLGDR